MAKYIFVTGGVVSGEGYYSRFSWPAFEDKRIEGGGSEVRPIY